MSQVEVADKLGIKRAAINNTLNGTGNITIETLALYLGAMGYEADLVAATEGEILASMRERRSPRLEVLTTRDRDWQNRASVLPIDSNRGMAGRRIRSLSPEAASWPKALS